MDKLVELIVREAHINIALDKRDWVALKRIINGHDFFCTDENIDDNEFQFGILHRSAEGRNLVGVARKDEGISSIESNIKTNYGKGIYEVIHWDALVFSQSTTITVKPIAQAKVATLHVK